MIDIKGIRDLNLNEVRGRITSAVGLFLRAVVPEARIGDICAVIADGKKIAAKVVGIDKGEIVLMPYSGIDGVRANSSVVVEYGHSSIRTGSDLTGRIFDALGRPIDGRGKVTGNRMELSLVSAPPPPLSRKKISSVLSMGIKVMDAFLTVGEGQRMGIFSGAGIGKSTLLGMICRNAESDVNILALVGERGREVREFIENILGLDGMKKSVVIVSTSDESPLMKVNSAYTATAIAEYFRDQGLRVVLMMDSVTRFARALREVALASGEPPARQGFPPSVFAELPKLLERTGNSAKGSITAFYTVLAEGDDVTDPISDEVRSILDGHIILSREIASMGIYPAVDILNSVSRVMPMITSEEQNIIVRRFKQMYSCYESKRDMVDLGMYIGGDPLIDFAVANRMNIREFLTQEAGERCEFSKTLELLRDLVHGIPD